ncbi:TDT family transporter [Lacrimispora sp. 210928-DFI.3.58]|uniref:TDT family transporter n=1 Tax=Lacrimispora sp. 210928-DFI.3.58 TaxID=2883214 RepID=UPI001D098B4B|nr:TDT family transporter [Lacrimispora sp. 210928-DFI.3.58]MCB7317747.1 TDT family transporter [Lacrimispora sp. 210928-DFI.3.58]
MNRLERMPVPVLPTFVGALTLGNVYSGMGYTWVRHLTMWAATLVVLLYVAKIVKFPLTCKKEYETVVPCSLYAGFIMVLMILGSYYFDYVPALGKGIWMAALAVHAVHILIFTYRNVIKDRNINTFVPSWFVTYNGIMVSCVIGGAMNAGPVLRVVLYYGIAVYFVILPFMLYRLITVEVKPAVYHTMAVLLAPCSLCVVSYLNVEQDPSQMLLFLLYACVLASLAFIIVKLPKFFSFPFAPGFAGMTFPMCIGIVATNKMTAYLAGAGKESWAAVTGQLSGIQIYLTTMIVGYVLLQFLIMALRFGKKQES